MTTPIDRESVERLARRNETRCQVTRQGLYTLSEPEPLGVETADTLRALRASLDAAEADKQLAVAAALREAAGYHHHFLRDNTALHIDKIFASSDAILALLPDAGKALDRALAAERERCAKVAYDAGCGWQELRSAALSSQWPEDAAKHLASEHTAFAIAAAIRAQKET